MTCTSEEGKIFCRLCEMKSIRDFSDFSKHAKARRPGSTEWGRDVGHRTIALERETRGAGSYQKRQKLSVK